MKECRNPVPATLEGWVREILKAYANARETIPFAPLTGRKMTANDLFHLAPSVCIEFRGIEKTNKNFKQATDAALTSYVATQGINKKLLSSPLLAFAFCYLCSHYGLDLITQEKFDEIMEYIIQSKL